MSTPAPAQAFADFGELITPEDVDQAVIATLKLWLPTYLGQIELERGLEQGFLPRPVAASYANTLETDEFGDHMLPAVIVTTSGTVGEPIITGDGAYLANWSAIVSSIVRGQRGPLTRQVASLFEGCVRRVLVQQGDLGAFARRTRWLQTRVMPVVDPTGKGRYLAAGMTNLVVHCDTSVREWTGPTVPDAAPYDALATVQTVTTDVEGVPIPTED